jgi:hypothetical protein
VGLLVVGRSPFQRPPQGPGLSEGQSVSFRAGHFTDFEREFDVRPFGYAGRVYFTIIPRIIMIPKFGILYSVAWQRFSRALSGLLRSCAFPLSVAQARLRGCRVTAALKRESFCSQYSPMNSVEVVDGRIG